MGFKKKIPKIYHQKIFQEISKKGLTIYDSRDNISKR